MALGVLPDGVNTTSGGFPCREILRDRHGYLSGVPWFPAVGSSIIQVD